jgi:hypothetical protein
MNSKISTKTELFQILVTLSLAIPFVVLSCSESAPSSSNLQQHTENNKDSTSISSESLEPCYNFNEDSVLSYDERLQIIRVWRDSIEAKNLWDAPWWYMSNQELADSIAVSDNEVLISFKEPTNVSSRDAEGRSVGVRDVTVENGIQWVASEVDMEIIRESDYLPSIHGKIKPTADIVDTLRNQPCVDILEPDYVGDSRWH